ncbi:MAG: hypothetical protein ABII90_06160 [Bacteroidota bacterium]
MKKIRNKKILFFVMLLSALLIWTNDASATISLTVDPASAPADTTTGFTFQTQAAEPGGSVQFEFYGDYNSNGIIDGDEWPIFKIVLGDNVTDGDFEPLTGDLNESSPDITTIFNPFGEIGGFLPAGYAIMRVQNSLGESATVQFYITPVLAPLSVTGTVYEQGTTTPVPYSVVFFADAPTGDQTVSITFADSDGNYVLQIPSPGDYEISGEKYGYITIFSILTVPPEGVENHSIYLIPADAQITGTITEYGTGLSLWGVEIEADTIDGKESWTTSDIDGNYTLHVLSGIEWRVRADDAPGYFDVKIPSNDFEDDIIITPTVTGPNIVNFIAYKETAWIEGTVLDEYGTQVVEGILLYANRINTADPALEKLRTGHYTDETGQVTVGVMPGDWRVGLCMNCHEYNVKIGGEEKELVPPAEVDLIGLTIDEYRPVTLQTYYADGAIEGRVYLSDGVTPAPSEVRVNAWTDTALNGPGQTPVGHYIHTSTETDVDGYYRLPLLGGTWTVRAEMYDWNLQSDTQLVTLFTDGNDVIDQPGEVMTGIDLILNLEPFPSDPVPDIKANGQDGALIVNLGEGVNITASLNPYDMLGETCDWWIGALTPLGTYWLNPSINWVKSNSPISVGQFPLFELAERSILNMPLPEGIYTFFSVLDDTPDGDFGVTWYDYVNVISKPAGIQIETLPDFDTIIREKINQLLKQ